MPDKKRVPGLPWRYSGNSSNDHGFYHYVRETSVLNKTFAFLCLTLSYMENILYTYSTMYHVIHHLITGEKDILNESVKVLKSCQQNKFKKTIAEEWLKETKHYLIEQTHKTNSLQMNCITNKIVVKIFLVLIFVYHGYVFFAITVDLPKHGFPSKKVNHFGIQNWWISCLPLYENMKQSVLFNRSILLKNYSLVVHNQSIKAKQ